MGSAMGHPKVTPVPKQLSSTQSGQNFQMTETMNNEEPSNTESTSSTTGIVNNGAKPPPLKLPPINNHRGSFVRRKASIDSLISQYGLSEEAIAEYRDAFRVCDRNNDGRITAQELGAVLRSLGQTATESELESFVYNVDDDGNGTIEFDEFLMMMVTRLQAKNEKDSLIEAFTVFDLNGDGFISPQEIKTAIANLGEQLTDQELREMIAIADTNGDGKISFDEFQAVWKMFAKT